MTLPEISQFCENYKSAVKDKNKVSDQNPLFYFKNINTKGISKDQVITATVIIYKESRIIQTRKIHQDAIIVAMLNIVKAKTALHKVKHSIYVEEITLSKFLDQSKNFYHH